MAADFKQQDHQFPPIESLAVIGDGQSLALLAPDGTLEWFCPARFDAPPLFWSVLDKRNGGYLSIAARSTKTSSMRYLNDTAVVEFEWTSVSGTARAQVAFEWPVEQGQQRILWQITGLRGTSNIEVDFFPKPDFAHCELDERISREGVRANSGAGEFLFQGAASLSKKNGHFLGSVDVNAGEVTTFSLTVATTPHVQAKAVLLLSVSGRIEQTAAAWRHWTATVKWTGRYRAPVIRSAVTLKLLIYEPTGAVVAAGTAALPEVIGGLRNWDYRFIWFRDAGLVLGALDSLGRKLEARRWADWMHRTVTCHSMPLRVLYTLEGGVPPPEQVVPNVQGYQGSAPVLTGNAAYGQFQLDVYGELLECAFICDSMGEDEVLRHWCHLQQAADFIAAHWREPDHGIWEARNRAQQFVHSKVAAWAGLKRALWLQDRHTLTCDRDRWSTEAAAIEEAVWRHGVNDKRTRFIRAYDDPEPDASLLLLARFGFVDGKDPIFQNTVDEIRSKLGFNGGESGLLLRYAGDDGLSGHEGAFIICGFWLVDALARGDRMHEAQAAFEALLAKGGSMGLYAEQIDPHTGLHLGNFPQAFSHVGLINAALQLVARSSGRQTHAREGEHASPAKT